MDPTFEHAGYLLDDGDVEVGGTAPEAAAISPIMSPACDRLEIANHGDEPARLIRRRVAHFRRGPARCGRWNFVGRSLHEIAEYRQGSGMAGAEQVRRRSADVSRGAVPTVSATSRRYCQALGSKPLVWLIHTGQHRRAGHRRAPARTSHHLGRRPAGGPDSTSTTKTPRRVRVPSPTPRSIPAHRRTRPGHIILGRRRRRRPARATGPRIAPAPLRWVTQYIAKQHRVPGLTARRDYAFGGIHRKVREIP